MWSAVLESRHERALRGARRADLLLRPAWRARERARRGAGSRQARRENHARVCAGRSRRRARVARAARALERLAARLPLGDPSGSRRRSGCGRDALRPAWPRCAARRVSIGGTNARRVASATATAQFGSRWRLPDLERAPRTIRRAVLRAAAPQGGQRVRRPCGRARRGAIVTGSSAAARGRTARARDVVGARGRAGDARADNAATGSRNTVSLVWRSQGRSDRAWEWRSRPAVARI